VRGDQAAFDRRGCAKDAIEAPEVRRKSAIRVRAVGARSCLHDDGRTQLVLSLKRLLQKPEAVLHVGGLQDVTHSILWVRASGDGFCNRL